MTVEVVEQTTAHFGAGLPVRTGAPNKEHLDGRHGFWWPRLSHPCLSNG